MLSRLSLVAALGPVLACACLPAASDDGCGSAPCPDEQTCDVVSGVCLKAGDAGSANEEPPADAGALGESPRDSGPAAPPFDAGADAGQPLLDGGQPFPDAGLPLPDAGQVFADAGQPLPDAGEALPDAGATYPYTGRATYYSGIENGSCGFGGALWPYIVAPAEWMNGDARLCGAFLEVTSRYAEHPGDAESCSRGATITVMVSDVCPAAANQEWCADPAIAHLDLSSDAFAALADPDCGVVEGLEWRFVERPDDEDLRIVSKDGVNAWWFAFFVQRHRYALTKAEVKDADDSAWTVLLRQPWNGFVLDEPSGITPPISVRLTDVHGQVVVLDDVITSLAESVSYETNQQFPAGLGGGDPL